MPKSDIIAGLDMGSSRVTCVLAEHDAESEKIRILAGASVPCKGLKGGVVVNIAETQRAIASVMEQAEEKAKEIVGEVYLGVRGGHIQTFNNRGAYNIARADKEITAEDVSNVIENAKAIPIPSDREILHVIPQGFSLDRQRGVPNPVGMEGALLEVGVHIVTAQSSHINNLMKSVSQAGFRVVDTVYNLLAIGELVVSPEEKDLGCLLIDIGGQTTAIGIYYEGSLRFSSEIPLGGDNVTRDIAYGLGTSMAAAGGKGKTRCRTFKPCGRRLHDEYYRPGCQDQKRNKGQRSVGIRAAPDRGNVRKDKRFSSKLQLRRPARRSHTYRRRFPT